jgi:hypothetical protein
LSLRQQVIVPHLKNMPKNEAGFHIFAEKALKAWWKLANGDILSVILSLHDQGVGIDPETAGTLWVNEVNNMPDERPQLIYQYRSEDSYASSPRCIFPKSIVWLIEKRGSRNA